MKRVIDIREDGEYVVVNVPSFRWAAYVAGAALRKVKAWFKKAAGGWFHSA